MKQRKPLRSKHQRRWHHVASSRSLLLAATACLKRPLLDLQIERLIHVSEEENAEPQAATGHCRIAKAALIEQPSASVIRGRATDQLRIPKAGKTTPHVNHQHAELPKRARALSVCRSQRSLPSMARAVRTPVRYAPVSIPIRLERSSTRSEIVWP